jgi:hypothetical protein
LFRDGSEWSMNRGLSSFLGAFTEPSLRVIP